MFPGAVSQAGGDRLFLSWAEKSAPHCRESHSDLRTRGNIYRNAGYPELNERNLDVNGNNKATPIISAFRKPTFPVLRKNRLPLVASWVVRILHLRLTIHV